MRKNKGFAIGIFLITFLVLGSVCSSMIYIASRDNYSSRQSNIKIETRILANTASNYFFSKVVSDTQYIDTLIDCVSTPDISVNCLSTDNKWAMINENGVQVACPTTSNMKCFQIRLKVLNRSRNPMARDTVRVSLKTKICPLNSQSITSPTFDKCRYTTYQQIFRKKQYYDYLYFADSIQLDPSSGFFSLPGITPCPVSTSSASARALSGSCYDVAFSNGDTITGPIRTNDDYFSFCGQPSISSTISVTVTGTGGSDGFHKDSNCAAPVGNLPSTKKESPIQLPNPRSYNQAVSDIQRNVALGCNLTSQGALNLVQQGTSTLLKDNSGSILCTITGRGLIAAKGPIDLKGVTTGNLTIIVDGDINISGDLTYSNGSNSSNTNDLLTLYSTGKITISKLNASDTQSTREISALMLSTTRAIETESWWIEDINKKTGTLSLYGAIAGNYMPVFSSRDESTGNIIAGYSKLFTYDDRLKSMISPYYALSPENVIWEKLNLSEVASNK